MRSSGPGRLGTDQPNLVISLLFAFVPRRIEEKTLPLLLADLESASREAAGLLGILFEEEIRVKVDLGHR
jgi:hypothetical protein